MIEVIASVLLLVGAGFAAVAGLGVLRFGDVFLRMHAATKAGTLGVGLIAIAAAIMMPVDTVIARTLLVIAFLLLTAPVAAHLVGRAAWRNGTLLTGGVDGKEVVDEWRDGRQGGAAHDSITDRTPN